MSLFLYLGRYLCVIENHSSANCVIDRKDANFVDSLPKGAVILI